MTTRKVKAASAAVVAAPAQADLAALVAQMQAQLAALAAPVAKQTTAAKADKPARKEWKYLDLNHDQSVKGKLADGRAITITRRYAKTFVTLD